MATSYALDRLGRPEIGSVQVAQALRRWQYIAALPTSRLNAQHNDYTEIVGPMVRRELEQAIQALPRRQGARLRGVVDEADELFRSKTTNNPRADPRQPWWARRWWH